MIRILRFYPLMVKLSGINVAFSKAQRATVCNRRL
jgi:hypothetical protein